MKLLGAIRNILAVLLLATQLAHADSKTWILVDTRTSTAEVLQGDHPVLKIKGLSFGRGGVSHLHKEGDDTTPLGEYRIRWINRDSRFHVFLELNYPTLHQLDEAERDGIIDGSTYNSLLDFTFNHGYVPQDSPLGGHIGLHGLGDGDLRIHRRFNWTEGCVAMTNAQIDEILKFVDVGTRVVIR